MKIVYLHALSSGPDSNMKIHVAATSSGSDPAKAKACLAPQYQAWSHGLTLSGASTTSHLYSPAQAPPVHLGSTMVTEA